MKNIAYHTISWLNEKDVKKVLRTISSIGYKGVELLATHYDPFFDRPKELSKLLESSHLEPVALTAVGDPFGQPPAPLSLTEPSTYKKEIANLKRLADFAVATGFHKVMVCAGPETRREDKHFKMLADALNEVGGYAKRKGVDLTFHPHLGRWVASGWFGLVEEKEHIDKFYKLVDPEKVGFCFDTGHLTGAGVNLIETIFQYRDQIDYVHLKDIRGERFLEIGKGIVNFPKVFDTFDQIGYSGWYCVELDVTPTPEESARTSWRYLKQIGAVE